MPASAIDLSVPGLAALNRRRSEKWAPHPPGVLSSTIAEMDFPLAAPVAEALHAAVAASDLGYTPGTPAALREAFAGFAARRLGWDADPDQVSLAPDVMAGLIELCRVLTRPGDVVAFTVPAYPPFIHALPQAGVRVRRIPLRPDGTFDLALLDGVRVLVLANPHNPTGRVLPRDELAGIAEWCAQAGIWVLSDEIHAPLVLGGGSPTPWLEVSDAARRWGVALTSASKAFNLAGLKASVIVTASAEARAVVDRLPDLGDRTGLLGVIGAEAAFARGDAWLDAVLARLAANRALLGDLLAARLPQVRWTPAAATYLAWLDCRGLGLGDDPAAAFLARGRVALVPGLAFGLQGAGFARLNFATSPELVEEMVTRMAGAVHRPDARAGDRATAGGADG
jgi:cysteine-S-conjugate beta-lyase